MQKKIKVCQVRKKEINIFLSFTTKSRVWIVPPLILATPLSSLSFLTSNSKGKMQFTPYGQVIWHISSLTFENNQLTYLPEVLDLSANTIKEKKNLLILLLLEKRENKESLLKKDSTSE